MSWLLHNIVHNRKEVLYVCKNLVKKSKPKPKTTATTTKKYPEYHILVLFQKISWTFWLVIENILWH